MDLKNQLKNIKTQFRLSMNGVVSQSMREKGLTYKINFGVNVPRIKEIAKDYDQNHDLAQTLWKEDIRESKILAALLQPIDSFYPEIADIWVESISNVEIAELTVMNLFQKLPYAPAKAFQWIAAEKGNFTQVCGYLTISRILQQGKEMSEKASDEFLDQANVAIISDSSLLRNAAFTSIRAYMNQSVDNSFKVCRIVEQYKDSINQFEKNFYQLVKDEIDTDTE